jgi:hypothetical protein
MLSQITNAINVSNVEKLAAVCALLRETFRRVGRSFSRGVSFLVRHSFSDGGMRRSISSNDLVVLLNTNRFYKMAQSSC